MTSECKVLTTVNTIPQDAVRKCLYSMMGLPFNGDLPKPCSAGTYWEAIYEEGATESTSLLRPDWTSTWSDNQRSWSLRATVRIQTRGHEYASSLSKEHLTSLSRDTIVDAIRVVFLSMVKRWKLANASDGAAIKKKRNLYAKKCQRKRNVSELRCAAPG